MADIDMSLDDIAAKNKPERKPRAEGGGRPGRGRGGGVQRTASGKTTPYAVSLPSRDWRVWEEKGLSLGLGPDRWLEKGDWSEGEPVVVSSTAD